MSLADVLKDGVTVMVHAQIKAMQVGAAAGLLIAIPALSLAPSTYNRSDAPPLVAAASLAASGALLATTLVIPLSAYRLVRAGVDGVSARAAALHANPTTAHLARVGLFGAGCGVALLALRVRVLAQMGDVGVCVVLFDRGTLWELFGFAVSGSSVALVVSLSQQLVRHYFSNKSADG